MQNSEIHFENNKVYAPFLLAASFQGLISFAGSSRENGILAWGFSPETEAKSLLERFRIKKEPPLPASDLFMAIDAWWKEISEIRNSEIQYGKR